MTQKTALTSYLTPAPLLLGFGLRCIAPDELPVALHSGGKLWGHHPGPNYMVGVVVG